MNRDQLHALLFMGLLLLTAALLITFVTPMKKGTFPDLWPAEAYADKTPKAAPTAP